MYRYYWLGNYKYAAKLMQWWRYSDYSGGMDTDFVYTYTLIYTTSLQYTVIDWYMKPFYAYKYYYYTYQIAPAYYAYTEAIYEYQPEISYTDLNYYYTYV